MTALGFLHTISVYLCKHVFIWVWAKATLQVFLFCIVTRFPLIFFVTLFKMFKTWYASLSMDWGINWTWTWSGNQFIFMAGYQSKLFWRGMYSILIFLKHLVLFIWFNVYLKCVNFLVQNNALLGFFAQVRYECTQLIFISR